MTPPGQSNLILVVGIGAVTIAASAYLSWPKSTPIQRSAAIVDSNPRKSVYSPTDANDPLAQRTTPPLSGSMFGRGAEAQTAVVAMPHTPSAPQTASAAPAAADPFADLAYVGSMTANGRTLALLEDRKTHEGWYVADGETWQSAAISAVSPHSITLTAGGKSHTIERSTEIGVVQLSADATGYREAVAAADARDNPPPQQLVAEITAEDALNQQIDKDGSDDLKLSAILGDNANLASSTQLLFELSNTIELDNKSSGAATLMLRDNLNRYADRSHISVGSPF